MLNSKCVYAFFLSFVLDSFEVSDHPQPRTIFSSKFSLTIGGSEGQQIAEMERNRCNWKPWTRIFSFALQNKYCIEVNIEGSVFIPQAIACFIAHISATFQLLIPFGMLSSYCNARRLAQNSVWSKLFKWVYLFSEISL